jgi:membrane fusion protein (multidrug efflux system)
VDQARASVEELKIQYERTRVYSPMDGVVAERHVDPGALVGQNTPIVRILDLTRLKTIVPVPEGSISDIRQGIDAEVRLDAFPDQTYRGRISRIRPIVDAETRSVNVEIEIENRRETLRPGMFARVRFGGQAGSEAPSVPRSALLTRGNSQGVYVLEDGNVAVFREIDVGRNEGGWLEVLGGLSPADVFITTGAQNVNEGDRVRLAGDESAPARGGGGRESRPERGAQSQSDASVTADREHSAP